MTQPGTIAKQSGLWLLIAIPPLIIGWLFLFWDPAALLKIRCWFDPILLQYNAVLAIIAILIPPVITIVYIREMKDEKLRRFRRDLDDDEFSRYEPLIVARLEREFRIRNYFASVAASMVVTALGVAILLFMKPIPPDLDLGAMGNVIAAGCEGRAGLGLDFTRGASFLLLGPFMKDIGDAAAFYPNLIIALTAFQFGFLGAWVHFIGNLTRSYFTCDLTPNTFVSSVVRMASASLLALVLSFILPKLLVSKPDSDIFLRMLPVISFFFGYFPSRALRVIENVAVKGLGSVLGKRGAYQSTPLTALSGISYQHEVRLGREGIDNVENLSHVSAIDFALRTGFGYRQLDHWISHAWLRTHMGGDYAEFARGTGITSRGELRAFLDDWDQTSSGRTAQELLKEGVDSKIHAKVDILCACA